MDSNSKHCPSRSSTDNLGKQPACGDEKKEPTALPSSCATSSATEDRTPSPGSEASSSLQPSTSFGVGEMVTSVTEVGIKGQEDCHPTTSQNVERSHGAPSSDLTITFGGSNPRMMTIPAETCLPHPCIPSPHLLASDAGATSAEDETLIFAVQSQSEEVPRGIKRSHAEVVKEDSASLCPVKQKNKKRCFKCSAKLELAQREIGRCRCERVFCSMHRLPEQHGCDFDHKEEGRREAREKIVKPTRHLGTSFQRLDHHS